MAARLSSRNVLPPVETRCLDGVEIRPWRQWNCEVTVLSEGMHLDNTTIWITTGQGDLKVWTGDWEAIAGWPKETKVHPIPIESTILPIDKDPSQMVTCLTTKPSKRFGGKFVYGDAHRIPIPRIATEMCQAWMGITNITSSLKPIAHASFLF